MIWKDNNIIINNIDASGWIKKSNHLFFYKNF